MSEGMARIALTALFVALFLLFLWLMRRSWRRRARRDPALATRTTLPEAEWGSLLREGLTGLFVGTVRAGDWNDRVAAGGLSDRAAGEMRLYRHAVVVVRNGADPVVIPTTAVQGARLAPRLAGKVVGQRGLLVVAWQHGPDQETGRTLQLESGFRADDPAAQVDWVEAVNAVVPTGGGA